MQKCLKFQFQSKILKKEIFVAVFTIIILFSSSTQVFAEPGEKINIDKYYEWEGFVSGVGEIIQTDKILFEVGKHGDVKVKHIIVGKVWHPSQPKLIEMLPGEHSNLQVTDEDGDYLRPIGFVGETFEESEYIIAGQKPQRGYDLVAEYDLENFMELNNGLWTKHFVFPHDVMVYFDDEIKNIFINSRGVDVSDVEGINCIGCDLKVEFFDDEEPIIKKVTKRGVDVSIAEKTLGGEEFDLEIFSGGSINNLEYIEELNYFSFNVNKENQLVWIKIPLDLLLSPYHVYLTQLDQEILVESDQIRKSEFSQTETHANLSFKPGTEGTVHVVGSTEMEHAKLLEALEKRDLQPVNETKEDVKEDVKEDEVVKDETAEEFYENWESTNPNTNNDNTISFVIIGILAVIVIGIIIKLKKN